MTSENEGRAALEREIHRAEGATPRSPVDTSRVRDRLHDFAVLMRADEKQVIPKGEPNLGSRSQLQYRVLRPIRMRNDRLLADLGELTAALADRVVALEAEVERLRSNTSEVDG